MTRNHITALLAATTLAVTVSACADDTSDDAVDDIDVDIEEDVEDDINEAADDLEQEVDTAVDDVEDAVDDAAGAVADAIDEVGEDAVELAARNLATVNAAEEFADAGYPIEGELSCTADATDDLTAVELDCSGETEDGGVASVTGSTTELPGESVTELEGDFVGFVDSEEVFRTDALG